jgi:hypothetical protein
MAIDPRRPSRAQQIGAARALLGWSRDRLAGLAGVPLTRVRCLERVGFERHDAFEAVRRVFEDAGVDFLSDGQSSPEGAREVRLRKDHKGERES